MFDIAVRPVTGIEIININRQRSQFIQTVQVILLAGIVRQNGRIVIPSGNDVLHVHDDVIVVTTDTTLQDIRDIISE